MKVTMLNAFKTQEVARLYLKKDWVLKSKFKFTLKPASREVQIAYANKQAQALSFIIQKSVSLIR